MEEEPSVIDLAFSQNILRQKYPKMQFHSSIPQERRDEMRESYDPNRNESYLDYEDVREEMVEFLFEALTEKGEKVSHLKQITERTGPLGGTSAQITGFYKKDGHFFGFAVNVYSDEKVEKPLLDELAKTNKRQAITDFIEGNRPMLPNGE